MAKPDFKLSALDKSRQDKKVSSGKIGAAFKNEDGSITLLLDPGVGIQYNKDIVYKLFPSGDKDG